MCEEFAQIMVAAMGAASSSGAAAPSSGDVPGPKGEALVLRSRCGLMDVPPTTGKS
jgi:hypothetical protein